MSQYKTTTKCDVCSSFLVIVKKKIKPLFGFIPQIGYEKRIVCPKDKKHYNKEIESISEYTECHG